MISTKQFLHGVAAAALIGVGVMASAGSASAYVVCNRDGDCWHTDNRRFDSKLGISIHPDDWYFHQDWAHARDRHLRDYHDGRGYYRGGVWITF